MTKKPIDLTKEAPTKLNQLTKDNMLAFMKTKSPEDKQWFKDLMKSNKQEDVPNPFYKEGGKAPKTMTKYNMPVVREAFAAKYFYDISAAGRKAKKKTNKKPSFEDELEAL